MKPRLTTVVLVAYALLLIGMLALGVRRLVQGQIDLAALDFGFVALVALVFLLPSRRGPNDPPTHRAWKR